MRSEGPRPLLPSSLPLAVALAIGALLGFATGASADPHDRPSQGALNGRRIFVSPGHGTHWSDTLGRFAFDRGLLHGLREDISNAQTCIDFLIPMLTDAGAEVVVARERSYQRHEVIVDNDQSGAPDYSEAGAWATGAAAGYRESGGGNGFGAGTYRYAQAAASETAVARFTPTIPEAGRYPVYVAWSASANRAPDALVRVVHTGGVTEARVDQTDQGSRWVFVGTFHFAAGRGGRVEVSNRSSAAGRVVVADAVRFGAGMGTVEQSAVTSGLARWQEHGRLWALYAGGGHLAGFSDLRTVPEFCNWWGGSDLYLMWHSNAGGGRGTTSFYYDVAKPLSPDSKRLAEALQAGIVAEARRLASGWVDRGAKPHLANWTEMVYTIDQRPVALVEVAFHDSVDDAALLRDPDIRSAVARGAVKAIVRYFEGAGATVPPLPPSRVRVTNAPGGVVRASWEWRQDPVDPQAGAPTAARVYLSPDGYGFGDGVAVAAGQTSFDIAGVAPGETVYVRVTQTNAAGESRPSEVLCARRSPRGAPPEVVLVYGFDRLDERVNVRDGRNTFDYIVQHAEALAALGGYGFDSASNEAVVSGGVQLADYDLACWILGEESTVDQTFDPGERTVVTTFLQGGGKLFASGAEIGWDLDARGADQAWFRQTFGAAYAADDAGEYAGRGEAGTPFGAVASFTFDDGSAGTYDVAYPDVFTASGPQARPVLAYQTAGKAGVENLDAQSRTVLFGFPLETVPRAQREALLGSVLAGLDVQPGSGGGSGTGSTGGGSSGSGSSGGASSGGGKVVGTKSSGGCALGGAQHDGGAVPLWAFVLVALALGAGLRTRRAGCRS